MCLISPAGLKRKDFDADKSTFIQFDFLVNISHELIDELRFRTCCTVCSARLARARAPAQAYGAIVVRAWLITRGWIAGRAVGSSSVMLSFRPRAHSCF